MVYQHGPFQILHLPPHGKKGHSSQVGTNTLEALMYLETLKFWVCGEKACLACEWLSVGIIPSANGTVTSPSI
jgi:hypothetical protein